MTYDEDIVVIDRVLDGDSVAFGILVEKYTNMIFKYVYSKFNNWDEAEDITQDIFIIVFDVLSSFRRESKFSTWMYSIMVNHCKNYAKKSRRMTLVPMTATSDDEEYDLPLTDERQNPEKEVIMDDSMRIVQEEIAKLPDIYRSILLLRDIDGVSYGDIADMLGIGLSNVKVRIHRGRELLKNQLIARGLV